MLHNYMRMGNVALTAFFTKSALLAPGHARLEQDGYLLCPSKSNFIWDVTLPVTGLHWYPVKTHTPQ